MIVILIFTMSKNKVQTKIFKHYKSNTIDYILIILSN
jgi:hypothetical protein